jgi:hypothetical protein
MDMLHEMNAKHAKEQQLQRRRRRAPREGAAAAAPACGRSDAELDRRATVATGMPPRPAQQAIEAILINHMNDTWAASARPSALTGPAAATVAIPLTGLVAVEHVGIMVLEMFFYRPVGRDLQHNP